MSGNHNVYMDLAIIITSSPQLGVDTVCDNQGVTLICHTDQATGNVITWYWSNQSQRGDTITVVARMSGIVYTCVIYDQEGEIRRANITVKASGEWIILCVWTWPIM